MIKEWEADGTLPLREHAAERFVYYKQLLYQSAAIQAIIHQLVAKSPMVLSAEISAVANYLGLPASVLQEYVEKTILDVIVFE